jgi:beta-glucanase (GH16 family)
MKKTLILIMGLITIHFQIYGQEFLLKCEGLQVAFPESFNQCNDYSWVLIFEDEFDGNTLDLTKWKLQDWGQGALYGNNGSTQEYNTLDNIVVSEGTCKIIAKKETVIRRAISYCPEECYPCANEQEIDDCILEDGLPNLRPYYYTSSNIWTKYNFSHGKFEARIKIPKGKGFFPAFWTFGGNPWNEIDIFEFWNELDLLNNYDPSKLSKVHHMNAWYDFNESGEADDCSTNYTGDDFSLAFHIFTLIWDENKIEWFVDGNLKRTDFRYYTLLGAETGCIIDAFVPYLRNQIYPQDPMAIILNLAIQHGIDEYGNDRSPDNSTVFPNQMEIDWVRYYQRHPCSNVYISDPDQFVIADQVYNVIVGEEITINCNFTINSGQQLDIVTKSSLTLNPGFFSYAGSILNTVIDPSICESLMQSSAISGLGNNTKIFNQNEYSLRDPMQSQNKSNIQIFPNPSDGTIILDFGNSYTDDLQIRIIDPEGKVINTIETISESFMTLEFPKKATGVYILYLLDTNKRTAISHRIIIH